MLINLIDKNCAKIISLFAISPGSNYNRKEIQDWTKLNNLILDNSLNKLLFFKVILGNQKIYSLNFENYFIKEILKEEAKIVQLPLKVQFVLIDFINSLSKLKINEVILFGSYSKLIFTEKSDIDIAIILKNEKSKLKIEKMTGNFARKISKKYKKEIQIHFFNKNDLKHKEDPLIKDILRNGKRLV